MWSVLERRKACGACWRGGLSGGGRPHATDGPPQNPDDGCGTAVTSSSAAQNVAPPAAASSASLLRPRPAVYSTYVRVWVSAGERERVCVSVCVCVCARVRVSESGPHVCARVRATRARRDREERAAERSERPFRSARPRRARARGPCTPPHLHVEAGRAARDLRADRAEADDAERRAGHLRAYAVSSSVRVSSCRRHVWSQSQVSIYEGPTSE